MRPVVYLPSSTTGIVNDEGITIGDVITVTWYNQDVIVKTEGISKGENYNSLYPENPVREGYQFIGWGEPEIGDNGNITIMAEWEKNEIVPEIPDDGKLYTIIVENEMPGHTYNSYQVFEGNFSNREDASGEKIAILSNIVWGAEFQKIATGEESKTFGDKLLETLKEKSTKTQENKTIYEDCKTAEDIAKVLQGKAKDGEEIREFAIIVGEFIKENNIQLTKGTSEQVTITENGVEKKYYKITELNPGYYIVIDEKEELDKNDAYSRYLIDVVQDVTMKPKSAIPTLSKKVVGDNLNKIVEEIIENGEEEPTITTKTEIDYTRNTAQYKIPSESYNPEDYDIKFELNSNIPIGVEKYKQYDYEIVDILSKGFDIDKNSVKVTVGGVEYRGYTVLEPIKVTADNYETYKDYFTNKGIINPEDNYGKTIVVIRFNELVQEIKNKTILEGQEVVVTYNAKLNGKGTTGKIANENEAYLTYTGSPYDETKKTTTMPSKTYTYTIELDLNKIAEIKKNNEEQVYEYLGGAKFEIYDEPEYVINSTGDKVKNETRKLIATIESSSLEENKGLATYSSLKAGIYYLKEVEAPEGYNKLKEEIKFTISAEYRNLDTIWKVEDKTNNKLVEIKIDETGNRVELEVQNTSGFELPITGGMGTVTFMTIGLIIMLIVIIGLKSNKKQN